MKILHGPLLLVLAVLLFLMLTAMAFAAENGQPHPQLTYGSIRHDSEMPSCSNAPSGDGLTEHWLKNCHRTSVLILMLGKLREDDPQFETKKRLLIERIDTLRQQDALTEP